MAEGGEQSGRELYHTSMEFEQKLGQLLSGELIAVGDLYQAIHELDMPDDDDNTGGEPAQLHPDKEPPGRGSADPQDLGRYALAAA